MSIKCAEKGLYEDKFTEIHNCNKNLVVFLFLLCCFCAALMQPSDLGG